MKSAPIDIRRPLPWDGVQSFLTVVHAGSVSAAAGELKVNHSTVLRRLGALEDAFATRLFDRLPTGYALTEAGQDLAEKLTGVNEQIDAAHRELIGQDVEIRGTIRVMSPETLVRGMLMPLISSFCARYPAVQIQLVVGSHTPNLTRREADVAIREADPPSETLIARYIGCVQTALYASKDYLASLPAGATSDDYRWVAPDDLLLHLPASRWMQRRIDPSRIALKADSLGALVDAVCCGIGVGKLLCPLADRQAELVQLAPPDPELDMKLWILTHPDLRKVARIRAFTSFMLEELASEPCLRN